MSGKYLSSFSNSGRYYAHISSDGKLRIWDVISCVLKQEYTPDVHLTSPFTDLKWISSSKKVIEIHSLYDVFCVGRMLEFVNVTF